MQLVLVTLCCAILLNEMQPIIFRQYLDQALPTRDSSKKTVCSIKDLTKQAILLFPFSFCDGKENKWYILKRNPSLCTVEWIKRRRTL